MGRRMEAELLIDLLESAAYTIFLNLFLGSDKKGFAKYMAMAAVTAALFVNIALADRIAIYHWSTMPIDCVIVLAYCHFCLRGGWKEHWAAILLFNVGLIASTVMTMLASSLWLPQGIAGWVTTGTAIRPALLLAAKLLLFVFLFLVLKIRKYFRNADSLYHNKIFLSAPFLVMILSSILLYLLFRSYAKDGDTYLYLVLLAGFLTLLVLVFYLLVEVMKKQNAEQEKLLMMEMISAQKKLFTEEVGHYRKVRKIEHDMKNRLLAIQYYFEQGQEKSGKYYLDQLLSELGGGRTAVVSLEGALEYPWMALIRIKSEEAETMNISVSCSVRNGCYDGIDPMDLCVVAGNLLDNAVTAELKNTGKKEISILVEEQAHYVHMSVRNWIEDDQIEDVESLVSEKEGRRGFYGIGLNNVSEIVKKYNGTMETELKGNWFVACVVLAPKN